MKAHDICDKIEHDIKQKLKYSEIMIHLESCEKTCNCDECKKSSKLN
ncbi:cation transporter dimerization domain-containing protein [Clostridium saccharoperbutylacetonicum]